ncbi:related to phosphatidylinositol-4-phosphate 5-kinase [Cephalotrichum gorgonifer]|uniref:1-phosphatidylinositol-4-phosphate 5-kinase n=1 Tax=Cephalotrichum gorgonifer TaxID=2041049 RepID=A0AAE8T068_9PEZI|nr:related to phosphatidylinositol-4-phosphate 5-kinase [Cephalotrichum gorgonifer]
MTAFLPDGNESVFATHIVDFNTVDFGLPPDKQQQPFDGRDVRRPDSRANTTNASSFDDTSTSTSSSRSDVSDDFAALPVDRSRTRATSMGSLANGTIVLSSLAAEKAQLGKGNGPVALVDRSVSSTATADSDRTVTAVDLDDLPPEPTTAPPPPPPPSHRAPSPPSHDTREQTIDAAIEEETFEPSSVTTPPAPTSRPPPPPTSTVTPATPTSSPPTNHAVDLPARGRSKSFHRLSSSSNHPSMSAPSLSAAPPTTTSQLTQRHTALEVPWKQSRGSRDGNTDAAFASGRFSPTAPVAASPSTRRASISLGRRNTRSMQSDLPRDEVAPDEDAMRWAEAYRQKRASKRRRREEEDDDRVLVGTKVDEHHANWVAAYNMLTGIRVSVSRTNAKLDREVTDADFDVKQKSTFDIAGNELVPSAKYDFKFKDYAPWVFRRLRSLFRLDPADYLMSLTGKYILSELGSPGKSGSFFYYSRDYKYIIKTIHHSEHKYLRRILKDYYIHVTNNPNTLLSQFYGLHRVKVPYGKKIHFVVMNNLFPPHRDIHQTFDLKGSTIGRDLSEDTVAENPRGTLKDLNWLRRKRSLELGITKKRLFLDQLQRDVALLKRLQIMDYSLLVGIHDLRKGNEENLRDKTLRVFNPSGERGDPSDEPDMTVLLRTPSKLENAKKARELRQKLRQERPVPMDQSGNRMPDELEEGQLREGLFNVDDGGFGATHEDNSPADEVYYLGVIDCLTHYNAVKKIEHFWKGLSHDKTQISALPPDQYGDRFLRFVSDNTMSAEEAARRQAEEAARAEQEAVAEPEVEEAHGGICPSGTHLRGKSPSRAVPPMPTHQPPRPPVGRLAPNAQVSQEKVSEGRDETGVEGAVHEAHHRDSHHGNQALPVVDEAAEASSTGARSHTEDEKRPPTPSKDAPADRPATPLKTVVGRASQEARRGREPPATPPKPGTMKPESADSGYGGVNGVTSESREGSVRHHVATVSRGSLDKELPPLPGAPREGGVRVR